MGRLGCLISGDGDYGIPTHLPWGMSFPHGLVPTPPGVKVQPTPIYELIAALVIAWVLWRRGAPERHKPVGQLTGEYLFLTGLARALVEIIRINPKIYWGMSNAQVASIGSMIVGVGLILLGAETSACCGSADPDGSLYACLRIPTSQKRDVGHPHPIERAIEFSNIFSRDPGRGRGSLPLEIRGDGRSGVHFLL